ncbi:hypothetical protein LXA43DRAFT_1095615 [Ganoderma leucocontextum]|nr:hypothetical protein LXA43DRAFT_1095615 [Ganoderma leucocontextum]
MSGAVAKSLIDLLPRMSSLDSLFLTIEHALESHPDLIPAFASLSQLVSAQLYFCPANAEAGQRLYLTPAFHPLIMLERSALTLTKLTCSSWFDMDPQAFFSLRTVTYSNMHTFTMYETRPPGLAPYIKSFPNLAHLTVNHSRASLWDSDQRKGLMAILQRHINLGLPGFSPPGFSSADRSLSWKKLRDYTDTPATRPPPALTDVLAYPRPTELTIAFQRCSLTDVLDTDFLSTLGTEGASGLRCLRFLIELKAEDRDLDVGRALDGIGATISHLDLTSLDIELRDVGLDQSEETSDEPDRESGLQPEAVAAAAAAAGVHGDAHTQTSSATAAAPNHDGARTPPTPTSASESKPLSLGERTLEGFDVHAFAARFACSSGTLQDAVVSIQSPRRCGGAMRTVRLVKVPAGIQLPAGQQVFASEMVGGEVSDRLWGRDSGAGYQ